MPEPRPSPEAQVVAIRATLIDTYGEDYAGEDVAAAIDLLFRHQGEHEANVQRILQAKNGALEKAQAERDHWKREHDELFLTWQILAERTLVASTLVAEDMPADVEAELAPVRLDVLRKVLAGEAGRDDLTASLLPTLAEAEQRRDERHKAEVERLREIERVTAPPAGELEMPADPAELRELWEFANRQARWQWHMAHKFGDQVERLRAENGLLRIRAAGADTRNGLLHADLAEARQRQAASDETVAVRAYQQVKAQRDRARAEAAALRAELEHAKAALAGDNEGVRLWMLDCAKVSERLRAEWDAVVAAVRTAQITHIREWHPNYAQVGACAGCQVLVPLSRSLPSRPDGPDAIRRLAQATTEETNDE